MIIEGRIAERRQITRGNSDRDVKRSNVVDTMLCAIGTGAPLLVNVTVV